MENSTRILALSDGKPGHVHQTEGILMRLPDVARQVVPIEYRSKNADNGLRAKVTVRRNVMTTGGARAMLESALTFESYEALMNADPPSLVLSTGSSVAAPNLLMSRIHRAWSVVCTRPSPIGVRHFDLAVLPRHQWRFEGENTVKTLGVPTHITPEIVEQRREALAARPDEPLPRVIGLLFGGNDRRYRWTVEAAQKVIEVLVGVAGRAGMKIAVATSRRTPPEVEAFMKARLAESPACVYSAFASDPPREGDNGVLTILALSAWVAVTVDSYSMVCEAASSGKPVGLIEIPPRRADRYAAAYDAISDKTGMFQLNLETLYEMALSFTQNLRPVTPLDDAQTAADAVRRLLESSPDGA
ncbi:MAG: ELM1/GtrOC1 family putative glycosyltransferase [Candidatus Poribacteria bacterium]|nr:ELM1/GtrOC1 family putative glycosyltransferase [Candidatus Poribacteria bacterium]